MDLWNYGLEVGVYVDDVGRFELFVVVLKEDLPSGLRHLDSYGGLVDASAVGLVLLQQVLSGEAVKAAFAEIQPVGMLSLVVKKTVNVFDPGVVMLHILGDEEEFDPAINFVPTELVNDDSTIFPGVDMDC